MITLIVGIVIKKFDFEEAVPFLLITALLDGIFIYMITGQLIKELC